MARPRKEGMDYFPHDVHMSSDKKVKALRIMYGNDGYTFYNIALEMIYQEPNYELDISDAETIQILASNVEVTPQKLSEMIATALKHKCFDQELYQEKGILTSNGIKKRASIVTKKRESMRNEYEKKVSDAETPPETDAETPQSKVKKSKRKELKDIGYSHEFESFFDSYPKQVGKPAAFNNYKKLRKDDKYTAEYLMECAMNYQSFCIANETEHQFIKMPNNFLNAKDEYFKQFETPVLIHSRSKSNIGKTGQAARMTISEYEERERLKMEQSRAERNAT